MKATYIIIGLVVVGVIAWLVFGNKAKGGTDTTGNAAATEPDNSTWFSNFGSGTTGGQTWAQWFNKNQADGWPMNTKLI